ncbi:hypothetical protein GCM10020218_093020 [Dactylosporangium vinaceum]
MAGTGGTLAGYLQLLRRERPGLLPAAATWRPAFDDLRAAGPGPDRAAAAAGLPGA